MQLLYKKIPIQIRHTVRHLVISFVSGLFLSLYIFKFKFLILSLRRQAHLVHNLRSNKDVNFISPSVIICFGQLKNKLKFTNSQHHQVEL